MVQIIPQIPDNHHWSSEREQPGLVDWTGVPKKMVHSYSNRLVCSPSLPFQCINDDYHESGSKVNRYILKWTRRARPVFGRISRISWLYFCISVLCKKISFFQSTISALWNWPKSNLEIARGGGGTEMLRPLRQKYRNTVKKYEKYAQIPVSLVGFILKYSGWLLKQIRDNHH